jgi:hypothetical protein
MHGAEPGWGQRRNFGIAMLLLAGAMLSSTADAQAQSWSVYGGDAAGTRYSAATEITKANVAKLRVVWTYHTGDAAIPGSPTRPTPGSNGAVRSSCRTRRCIRSLNGDACGSVAARCQQSNGSPS